MLQIKSVANYLRFNSLWAIGIALGWAVVVYPGLELRSEAISSWTMLLPIAVKLFGLSSLLGGIIGLFQYLFCRLDGFVSWQWALVSAVSYGLGTSFAFLISSGVTGALHPEIFNSGGTNFMLMPLPFVMLIGGSLTAFIQAFAFEKAFFRSGKEVLSWTLASGLIWEMGYFVSSYAWGRGFPAFLQSGLCGLIVGLGTAILLGIQSKSLELKAA